MICCTLALLHIRVIRRPQLQFNLNEDLATNDHLKVQPSRVAGVTLRRENLPLRVSRNTAKGILGHLIIDAKHAQKLAWLLNTVQDPYQPI